MFPSRGVLDAAIKLQAWGVLIAESHGVAAAKTQS